MKKIKIPTAWNRVVNVVNIDDDVILYKMEFSGFNKSLAPRTEYVKSKIERQELENTALKWCTMSSTEYYGYTNVKVTVVTDVPEIAKITMLNKQQVKLRQKKFEKQNNIVKANSPKSLKRKLAKTRKK